MIPLLIELFIIDDKYTVLLESISNLVKVAPKPPVQKIAQKQKRLDDVWKKVSKGHSFIVSNLQSQFDEFEGLVKKFVSATNAHIKRLEEVKLLFAEQKKLTDIVILHGFDKPMGTFRTKNIKNQLASIGKAANLAKHASAAVIRNFVKLLKTLKGLMHKLFTQLVDDVISSRYACFDIFKEQVLIKDLLVNKSVDTLAAISVHWSKLKDFVGNDDSKLEYTGPLEMMSGDALRKFICLAKSAVSREQQIIATLGGADKDVRHHHMVHMGPFFKFTFSYIKKNRPIEVSHLDALIKQIPSYKPVKDKVQLTLNGKKIRKPTNWTNCQTDPANCENTKFFTDAVVKKLGYTGLTRCGACWTETYQASIVNEMEVVLRHVVGKQNNFNPDTERDILFKTFGKAEDDLTMNEKRSMTAKVDDIERKLGEEVVVIEALNRRMPKWYTKAIRSPATRDGTPTKDWTLFNSMVKDARRLITKKDYPTTEEAQENIEARDEEFVPVSEQFATIAGEYCDECDELLPKSGNCVNHCNEEHVHEVIPSRKQKYQKQSQNRKMDIDNEQTDLSVVDHLNAACLLLEDGPVKLSLINQIARIESDNVAKQASKFAIFMTKTPKLDPNAPWFTSCDAAFIVGDNRFASAEDAKAYAKKWMSWDEATNKHFFFSELDGEDEEENESEEGHVNVEKDKEDPLSQKRKRDEE